MTFEMFDDLLDRSERRPASFRRRVLWIPILWALFAGALLFLVPGATADGVAVLRTVIVALIAAVWWWTWFELLDRFRALLRRHPEMGDMSLIVAYLLGMVAYPVVSFALVLIVY